MRTLNLCLLLSFCLPVVASAQGLTDTTLPQLQPSDVHVKLVLVDNKKTFRTGDPIRLAIEFTADRSGYYVDTAADDDGRTDVISLAPDDGVLQWRREMSRGVVYIRDFFIQEELTLAPKRVPLTLNENLAFHAPGHYTVKITTSRVSQKGNPNLRMVTNEVEFDVTHMSDEEERVELSRLTKLLDGKGDSRAREQIAKELSYLTGELSTREKVRRFLLPDDGVQNYGAYMLPGFYIARDREFALRLLENGLRDTNQPVSPPLLAAVTGLRLLKENGPGSFKTRVTDAFLTPGSDPKLTEVQDRYLNELVLNLSKRSGKSLTTTAMTILMTVPKSDPNRTSLVAESKRVLTQQFNSLHPYSQDYLLRMYWDDLRDDSMLGPLKQMLTSNSTAGKGGQNTALKRLIEISPEEARPFVVSEVCEPRSFLDREIVNSQSYKELPEVDRCLSAQVREYAKGSQNIFRFVLEQKAALAVRFATENIYQDIAEALRTNGSSLSLEARAALLAYMAKHKEAEAIPLIEQTLDQLKPEEDFNFLPKLTELYFSEAIGNLIRKRLENDEPQIASDAAYLIGKYGAAGDEKVLAARLARWQTDWRDRLSEAEATHQGMIEREIIWALTNGKSWKFSAERIKELKLSCLTKMCQQSNRLN